jgi:quercetin dioxygenase-like cupin family protein
MTTLTASTRATELSFPAALTALLADGATGAGNLVVVERTGRRGEATPVHVHPEPEVLYVVEGAVTAHIGAVPVRVRAEQTLLAPEGVPHALRIDSDEARYVSATIAPSAARYEDFLRATALPADVPPSSWEESGDALRVAALAAPNGIEVLGPPA